MATGDTTKRILGPSRRPTIRPPRPPWYARSGWRLALWAGGTLVLVMVLAAGAVVGMGLAFATKLPDISALYAPPSEATRVYASNGELIASLYRENRDTIPLEEIPAALQQAVIAIEDERFYQHRGVDLRGTARAMWRNLLAGELREGGSTITQQLARSVFLTQKRQFSRKLAEMMLAVEIERRLTKAEILERYLNQVYFGQGAYGVEMAARVYFGKRARELNLAESALLAGLIRAPTIYSPHQNPELAKARQRVVLTRMMELGYLTPRQAAQTAEQPLKLTAEGSAGLIGIRAPYFVSYILPYLLERYGEEVVYNGGLRVYTTMDVRLQAAAEKAIRQGIEQAEKQKLRVSQGALVAIEPETGFIRAMIGGYDFAQSQFNRAWQAHRQPGSAFKPFIYTAAVANRMTTTRRIVDEPVRYEIVGATEKERIWEPKNYDGKFRGEITLRAALEQSINIPAVKTLAEIGPQTVIAYARRMGITTPLRPHLSLALGTPDLTPLEMASAYGTLAAMGVHAEPIAVRRITTSDGQVLEDNLPRRDLVLSADVSYLMIDLLKGVILRGTGRAADIGRPAAGKTGTTDDYRNAWFIGFTPQLSTAVWVGNDDNTPMRRVVGGTVPARIWREFMRAALEGTPPEDWVRPEGVVEVTVCAPSGLLATPACPHPRRELFIRGTEPTEYDSGAATEAEATRVTGSVPLQVLTPRGGQEVSSPFAVEGATVPGATVTLSILAQGGFLRVQLAETTLPVTDEGRFNYVFRPSLRIAGVRYLITITATTADGARSTATLTVTER
ncbi:MAG: penicillin-binding protein 1A [Armatimonadota bacterium]|nr:penicillin-binding protein 1A [Armatimonadota bacterium]MDR7452419.1 penicillin-binding protein 1A [Armatimonadota bacterium]MDR7468090.1 penicillin-binding protein 1A [Armatimonadota bacterium]MDR7494660.1 penicillin-binding protein 1A [Armatimonadota bacterium]MDR7500207.1 penicillin-binding protein 1A [Armatimonadota bacterium]